MIHSSSSSLTMSTFVLLPAELLVETGDYLDGCDLYRAFFGLNRRIDRIVDEHCHRLRVDLHGLSKSQLEICSRTLLPKFVDRLVSLTLGGNHSSTPGEVLLMFTRFPQIFVRLESLKIIDPSESDLELLRGHLPFLRSLVIAGHSFAERWEELVSSSIERLEVLSMEIDVLPSLFVRCPALRRLNTALVGSNPMPSLEIFPALQWLKVDVSSQLSIFDDFARLLSRLCSLRSLLVEGQSVQLAFLEAERWEACLPRSLVSFRFDVMIIQPADVDPRSLVDRFKRPFWLSRRWFVQCSLRDQGRYTRLFTVPSPPTRTLYWPDDELPLDSTSTLIYRGVVDLHLWWNVARSIGGRCPRLRTLHLHGVTHNPDEEIHPEVVELLRGSLLRHLVIGEMSPLSQRRFGVVLVQCSDQVDQLTCSSVWLRPILSQKHYERLCLFLALRIRRLTLRGSGLDLISFSRTFLHLEELTVELPSLSSLLFLLQTLQRLTTIRVQFPLPIADPTDSLASQTNLDDFLVQPWNPSGWLIWIGGRRKTSLNVYFESLE